MRWLRFVLLAAMTLLTVAFTGDGFAGCTGSAPPTGRPLPVSGEQACFAQSDCPPMACEDRRCVAGRCIEVATFRDADEDGVAPAPCGDDCDDADARVFGGARELCNGRDDDCDGDIDEEAPPGAIATPLGTADQQMAATALADRIVLTDSGFGTELRLRTADFAGHISTATHVADEAPLLSELATIGDGAVLVTATIDGVDAVIEARPLSLTSSRALLVGEVAFTLRRTIEPSALAVEPFGDSFALAWDEGTTRFLMVPSWSDPIVVTDGALGIAPLDLATDGTHLLVPSASDGVDVFDELGALVTTVTVPGRLAEQPLASSTTDFVVGFHDVFDHVLARATLAGAGMGHPAPAVSAGLPLRVDETPLGVLVTRYDGNSFDGQAGVGAQLLDASLEETIATFPATEVSAGISGDPRGFDVIASEAGTAVLTNFGNAGAVLTVLGCQPR